VNWVRDIIADAELADELLRAANRDEAAQCISIEITSLAS